MPHFTYQISMAKKDGSSIPAGEFTMEADDYQNTGDAEGLAYLTQHATDLDFKVDQDAGMVMCGGVMVLLNDFEKLTVRLEAKRVD